MQTIVFMTGFLAQATQIVAFGPQNLFVLRQGVARDRVLATTSVCVLTDIVLISVGVFGTQQLNQLLPYMTPVLTVAAIAFLSYYGFKCFRSAMRTNHEAFIVEKTKAKPAMAVLLQAAAVSLLNPHVWLDTVVVLGSMAQRFSEHWAFFLGAVICSVLWFAILGYGAGLLKPYFTKPKTWRIIDATTGSVMWILAVLLLAHAL